VDTKSVVLAGINPSNWNIWEIKQSGSTIEVYINDQKWMDYNSAPIITNGRIQLRTSNPTIAFFDNVNVDGIEYRKDGTWSYPWSCVSGTTELRATYNPANWYYNYTSAEITNLCCGCIGSSCTLNSDCLSNFCSAGICKCISDTDCCPFMGGPCSTKAKCSSGSCVCGPLGSFCPV